MSSLGEARSKRRPGIVPAEGARPFEGVRPALRDADGRDYSSFRKACSRGSMWVSVQLQALWFRFAPQRGQSP